MTTQIFHNRTFINRSWYRTKSDENEYIAKLVLYIKQIYILFFLLNICVVASSQTSDPLDTIYQSPKIYGMDNYSYLIQGDTFYDFSVKKITNLRDGILMCLTTEIDTTTVDCFVISPQRHPAQGEKIKEGGRYKLLLKRYNLVPANAGIEYIDVVDFLLGGKKISVNEDGIYKYMFYSPFLSGRRIMKKSKIEQATRNFSKDSADIADFIKRFTGLINENFTQKELYSICDKTSLKKSMAKYGVYGQGRSPQDLLQEHISKFPWTIEQTPPKYYSIGDMLKKDVYQMFREMLQEEYRLPSNESNKASISILVIQPLYFNVPSLYTLRVIWEDKDLKKRYVAVCEVKKTGEGTFLLSSFNKPYQGYRLNMYENNIRYVPLY